MTPKTEAGRRLLDAAAANETPVWSGPDMVALEVTILAIEAEAAKAERERLLAKVGKLPEIEFMGDGHGGGMSLLDRAAVLYAIREEQS